MTERFYPKASKYFARISHDRPIFQGDIFAGGFGALWRHPTAVQYQLAGQEALQNPPFPKLDELHDAVLVQGKGYAMILPQPCDYSEGEKGTSHPLRLVAPLLPLDRYADVDHDKVRSGEIGHTLWVPQWKKSGVQDFYLDLRLTTSIDRTFLTRDTRVAALSMGAWVAMVDRLSRYFIGVPVSVGDFAMSQGLLYPDAANA